MRSAAVMLVIKDGLILSVSRKNNTFLFGLVGGKVDEGETPEQAAIRECFEETGVKVKTCVQLYKRVVPAISADGLDFSTYCFYAIEWEGSPQQQEEGIIAWLSAEELTTDKGAFPDYNRKTIQVFRQLYPDAYLK